jgi:hypothetical protein
VDLNLVNELATLQRLTIGQLRQRFAEVFGEATAASNRTWLVKRIVWRLQALAEGDLSERARRRAAELARDAAWAVGCSGWSELARDAAWAGHPHTSIGPTILLSSRPTRARRRSPMNVSRMGGRLQWLVRPISSSHHPGHRREHHQPDHYACSTRRDLGGHIPPADHAQNEGQQLAHGTDTRRDVDRQLV